jgi:hypothetical protein
MDGLLALLLWGHEHALVVVGKAFTAKVWTKNNSTSRSELRSRFVFTLVPSKEL